MEQVLGHATHYRNMREFACRQPDVAPVWLPISFEVSGTTRLVPVLRSNWSLRGSWRARQALSQVRTRLDAVFFHTQVMSLMSIGLMRSVPSVISLDATPINYDTLGESYGHRPAGDGLLDRQKFELNRRAFQAAAGLVTWSSWARASLVDDYGVDPARVRVVPPGANPKFFDIGRARESAPRRPGRVRLLFVGGDFRRKGGPELLEALGGPLADTCELHVVTEHQLPPRPNVIVHRGLKPNSAALLALFAEADIFVLPTHADCLGVALVEAAAAGLPTITTDDGAQTETQQPGSSGLLVPRGSVRDLHMAAHALARDPARRQRMGRAAFELANTRFNAERNNRDVLDFMSEIVDARAARRAA
jgi:glycosyltransferase involved in cell wall biosynthesis